MAQAKVYAAVKRASKGRLKPKDKHEKESWKKRNAARADKQAAYPALHPVDVAILGGEPSL